MRAAKRVVAMLVPVLAAACKTLSGEYEGPISERYAVAADASPACVAAAKRASRWCIASTTVNSDAVYSQNCTDAQWDYARNCR